MKKNSGETHFQNGQLSVSHLGMIKQSVYPSPETYTVAMSLMNLNQWQLSSMSRSLGFSMGPAPFASFDPCRNVVEWKNAKGLQLWYCRQARRVCPCYSRQGAGVVAVHGCSRMNTPWWAPLTPGNGLDGRRLSSLCSLLICSFLHRGGLLASTLPPLIVARRAVSLSVFSSLLSLSLSFVVVVDSKLSTLNCSTFKHSKQQHLPTPKPLPSRSLLLSSSLLSLFANRMW